MAEARSRSDWFPGDDAESPEASAGQPVGKPKQEKKMAKSPAKAAAAVAAGAAATAPAKAVKEPKPKVEKPKKEPMEYINPKHRDRVIKITQLSANGKPTRVLIRCDDPGGKATREIAVQDLFQVRYSVEYQKTAAKNKRRKTPADTTAPVGTAPAKKAPAKKKAAAAPAAEA